MATGFTASPATLGLDNLFGLAPKDDFTRYLESQGMSIDQYKLLPVQEQAGIDTSFTNLGQTGQLDTAISDSTLPTGLGGTGLGLNMDTAKLGLGVGQLGLGIASFLDNKKTAKLQREGLSQQIADNRDLIKTRKARASDISGAFGAN